MNAAARDSGEHSSHVLDTQQPQNDTFSADQRSIANHEKEMMSTDTKWLLGGIGAATATIVAAVIAVAVPVFGDLQTASSERREMSEKIGELNGSLKGLPDKIAAAIGKYDAASKSQAETEAKRERAEILAIVKDLQPEQHRREP